MGFWLAALAAPIAGFALLIAQPGLDRVWEHHPAHFWLVLAIAGINVLLGLTAGEAARRLADARLFLVAMASPAQRSWGFTRWQRRESCWTGRTRASSSPRRSAC